MPCTQTHTHKIKPDVLVLTHEWATQEEQVPYMQQMWHPVPVLNLYGRSAAAEPAVIKGHAVWYGWKDSLAMRAVP